MTFKEKIDLIGLPQNEEKKALRLFLATLSLLDSEELKEVLNYLKEKNIQITKASELKVLCIPKHELEKKFSILGEINETDIFKDPKTLAMNAIDLYKRIQSCKANGISYKTPEGYSDVVKSEKAFRLASPTPEVSIISTEPENTFNNNVLEFPTSPSMTSTPEPSMDKPGITATGIIDLSALTDVTSVDKASSEVTSYDKIRANLEAQRKLVEAMGAIQEGTMAPPQETKDFRSQIENDFDMRRAA